MEPAAAGTRKPLPQPPDALARDRAGAVAAAAATWPAPAWASTSLLAAGQVAVGLGGVALLVWWAVAFHRANARLWMVPAGLVLLGTPLVAWLSVLASGPCDRSRAPPPAALGA
ncbi:hypothetical protein CFC21_093196 [Triticum aestivum]|uniref:Uncharacterized protein n=4 Tax=Triticinae TaxID=1648030 RepID=A0A9R1MV78_WHEAT|nr:uncharacterized protein LOC109780860 [Aegilops tauschii subsp. strangulata]KAF7090448.1 hypothetical protein CFC21_093196 [Triticum aestivum]